MPPSRLRRHLADVGKRSRPLGRPRTWGGELTIQEERGEVLEVSWPTSCGVAGVDGLRLECSSELGKKMRRSAEKAVLFSVGAGQSSTVETCFQMHLNLAVLVGAPVAGAQCQQIAHRPAFAHFASSC